MVAHTRGLCSRVQGVCVCESSVYLNVLLLCFSMSDLTDSLVDVSSDSFWEVRGARLRVFFCERVLCFDARVSPSVRWGTTSVR